MVQISFLQVTLKQMKGGGVKWSQSGFELKEMDPLKLVSV